MEWRNYYMDLMLVPLGLLITLAYHVWLWHKIRTQPYTTIFGIDADGRRFWVPTMMKDIVKNNIVAVQAIRNLLMGSTLMATTSILLSAGLGAVISSTYSVKRPIRDSVFGANGEFVVALKYATVLAIFLLSFLCHALSIRFLNQLNILISTPQDAMSMVTPEYLTVLLEKATILNVVGNRFFYTGLPLLLWIFGPLMAFLSCVATLPLLYNLDFVAANGKVKAGMEDIEKNNIITVQAIRNLLMGSTLMATTSILLSAGVEAVISSTYSVKKPIKDSVFGANGEFVVALKYATLLAIFLLSFLCHTYPLGLDQLNILISKPQDATSMVTPEYLTVLMEKATILNVVGNRMLYAGLPLLLWIFGPLMAFLSCVAKLLLFYSLDFVAANGEVNAGMDVNMAHACMLCAYTSNLYPNIKKIFKCSSVSQLILRMCS